MTTPGPGSLRIIGGRWRGRKISFPDLGELRPTPNRVRETLFNWLDPVIAGAACIDLFAGSGALTIEALSRGAAQVTSVDSSAIATQHIKHQLERLCEPEQPVSVELIHEDVLVWLARDALGTNSKYDIAFIDPPFAEDLAAPCCRLLDERALLAPRASIYIESARTITQEELPGGWRLYRQKRAGRVHYCLCLTP